MKYILNTGEIKDRSSYDKNGPLRDNLVDLGILIPVPEKEWPQNGDEYWSVRACMIFSNEYDGLSLGRWDKATGNMFRTKEAAAAYRNEVMSKEI